LTWLVPCQRGEKPRDVCFHENSVPSHAALSFEAACQPLGGNMSPESFLVHGQEARQIAEADRRLASEMCGERGREGISGRHD
jgi:hypothetical protein